MKILVNTCIAAFLIVAAIGSAAADSGELGNEFLLRSDLVDEQTDQENEHRKRAGSMASYGIERDLARAEDDEAIDERLEPLSEYDVAQEERQRELDDEYRGLVADRLEQDAEHHAALLELEDARARGAAVEQDYRELMEERREQDVEHRKALRELDRRRAEFNQGFAAN